MSHRYPALLLACAIASASLATAACAHQARTRPLHTEAIDTGAGTVSDTRKMLEGTWALDSLEVVDANGGRRRVKAGGELVYDGFGNMTVRGVVDEPGLKETLVLDFTGRITIDPVKHEFYPADLKFERPFEQADIAPISPDKVRRYELSQTAFVVTYLDATSKPTAVIRWRRE